MEEIKIISVVFISFSMGMFIGALITFWKMYNNNKALEEELDVKNELLFKRKELIKASKKGYFNEE